MKTRLTEEESQHLIYLGVPKEKASENISYGFAGSYPIFQLDDFLNGKILPERLTPRSAFTLVISWLNFPRKVQAGYIRTSDTRPFLHKWFRADELIDSLYQLTCWYYGEWLLNKTENDRV